MIESLPLPYRDGEELLHMRSLAKRRKREVIALQKKLEWYKNIMRNRNSYA